MDTSSVTFSVTDLRHKTNRVLQEAKKNGYAFLFRRSKAEAALVDIDYLRALREAYEDYLDTLEFDKTLNLRRIPLDLHKRRLGKDK